jgi:transposase-like protein
MDPKDGNGIQLAVPSSANSSAIASTIEGPDPEVVERARRRRFTAEYKLRILREADGCTKPGELGALLRREGLYSSQLAHWRRQRREGMLSGLRPKKRGRKAKREDPQARRVAELEKENERLRKQLKKAETLLEVQKKLSEVLGIPLKADESDEDA